MPVDADAETELKPRFFWEEPKRRRAAAVSRGCKLLRTVVVLARLLEEACEDAADEVDDSAALRKELDDANHTARLLRSLATQCDITADLIAADLPRGGF